MQGEVIRLRMSFLLKDFSRLLELFIEQEFYTVTVYSGKCPLDSSGLKYAVLIGPNFPPIISSNSKLT
jgi:hypothetical protein